jgi:hypothetical protein
VNSSIDLRTVRIAERAPDKDGRMDIAPGIHNVITEQAPAPGVTTTYLIIGTEGAVWVERAAEPPGPQSDPQSPR